eukprot:373584-Amphidinium_carterae.1
MPTSEERKLQRITNAIKGVLTETMQKLCSQARCKGCARKHGAIVARTSTVQDLARHCHSMPPGSLAANDSNGAWVTQLLDSLTLFMTGFGP